MVLPRRRLWWMARCTLPSPVVVSPRCPRGMSSLPAWRSTRPMGMSAMPTRPTLSRSARSAGWCSPVGVAATVSPRRWDCSRRLARANSTSFTTSCGASAGRLIWSERVTRRRNERAGATATSRCVRVRPLRPWRPSSTTGWSMSKTRSSSVSAMNFPIFTTRRPWRRCSRSSRQSSTGNATGCSARCACFLSISGSRGRWICGPARSGCGTRCRRDRRG